MTERREIEAVETLVDVLSQGDEGTGDDAFFSRLCEAVCTLTELDRAVIFRYDREQRRVRAVGAHGVDRTQFEGARLTTESAKVAEQALAEDRVIDVVGVAASGVEEAYAALVENSRVVCVPMTAAGRRVGVIIAARPDTEPPIGERETHLLWTLGKTAALASVARIAASRSERAQALEQRIDLAREIHDGAIQRLFGVSLALSADRALSAEERQRCSTEIEAALAALRTAVGRPLSRMPRPTSLTFAQELDRLAGDYPELRIVARGDVEAVPESLEPLAQSVLGEALRNVHKHAGSAHVDLLVEASPGGPFVLEITNDGARAEGLKSVGGGVGLRLISFEALQWGGVVEYGPLEPASWQVRLVVTDDGA